MCSLVVAWFTTFRELLQDSSERSHTLGNVALLVLCDSALDVGKDEIVVERSRLVVVGNSLFKVLHDEVHCNVSDTLGLSIVRVIP